MLTEVTSKPRMQIQLPVPGTLRALLTHPCCVSTSLGGCRRAGAGLGPLLSALRCVIHQREESWQPAPLAGSGLLVLQDLTDTVWLPALLSTPCTAPRPPYKPTPPFSSKLSVQLDFALISCLPCKYLEAGTHCFGQCET